ncbi:MAG: hypothetical protein V1709_05670 [Planctomycetota bacterium]
MKIIKILLVVLLIVGVTIISYFSFHRFNLLKKKSSEVLTNLPDLSSGQAGSSSWAKTYGTASPEKVSSIEQTNDGGYIMIGFAATASSTKNIDSFRVIKLNPDGKIMWQKTYDGAVDYGYFIHQTKDGGYIIAGNTGCYGGNTDAWILKLDSNGKIEWQKTYGGTGADAVYSIQQTGDEGYIVAGFASLGAGGKDFWILKLNNDGSIAWQKTYGGPMDEIANSAIQTVDGGYIVAGWTVSFSDVDISKRMADFWILKLNSDGSIIWQKTYGGVGGEWARTIQETKDGYYIVSGITTSFGAGNGDIWIIKLNSDGTIIWQKGYGGKKDEGANSIQITNDNGCIVAGATTSFGAGSYDAWLLKLNSDGMIEWQKTYGGSAGDWGVSVQQTKDGGYIVAGETGSYGSGSSDAWVLKLKKDGTIKFSDAIKAIIIDTTITPTDTSAIIINTTAQYTNTNATPKDTNVVPADSNATITTQSE